MSQRIFLSRARLAAAILLPAWALVTLLLTLWQPLLAGQPDWLVAAIIVPQMVFGMVFVIIPITQGLLVRLSARRQPDQTDTH